MKLDIKIQATALKHTAELLNAPSTVNHLRQQLRQQMPNATAAELEAALRTITGR